MLGLGRGARDEAVGGIKVVGMVMGEILREEVNDVLDDETVDEAPDIEAIEDVPEEESKDEPYVWLRTSIVGVQYYKGALPTLQIPCTLLTL